MFLADRVLRVGQQRKVGSCFAAKRALLASSSQTAIPARSAVRDRCRSMKTVTRSSRHQPPRASSRIIWYAVAVGSALRYGRSVVSASNTSTMLTIGYVSGRVRAGAALGGIVVGDEMIQPQHDIAWSLTEFHEDQVLPRVLGSAT